MRVLIVLAVASLSICLSVSAQQNPLPLPDLEEITPENTHQMMELAVFQHFDPLGVSHNVHDVAFSPDGRLLAFIDGNFSELAVFVWDVVIRREVAVLDFSDSSIGMSSLQDVAFSHDGAMLAMLASSGMEIWDTETFDRLPTPGESYGSRFATFADDNQSVVTVDGHGVLKRWDLATGEVIFEANYDLYGTYNYLGALSLDGSRFVYSKRYFTDDTLISDPLYVVDTTTGEVIQVIEINSGTFDVFLSHDGSIVVTYHPYSDYVFWDTESGEEITVWKFIGLATPRNLIFNSDKTLVATRGPIDAAPGVHIWSFPSKDKLFSYEIDGFRQILAFHPANTLLAATSDDYSGGAPHGRVHLFGIAPCHVISSHEVNLRNGPGTGFSAVDTLRPGVLGYVDGKAVNEAGTVWWRLTNGLWVSEDVVEMMTDNCDNIPLLENP